MHTESGPETGEQRSRLTSASDGDKRAHRSVVKTLLPPHEPPRAMISEVMVASSPRMCLCCHTWTTSTNAFLCSIWDNLL
ncbi:hypothetical protein NQZ68_029396 [Dissostichus eleginoides]|nr:hypothetical protein NQZ68_029396 [Dissostichus eleginoides]